MVRLGAAAAAATLLALSAGGPASAHVRVKPDSTVSGSFAALTFRVPTESDTASTTKLVLTLPQDTPFAHVSVRPVPGWNAVVTEASLPTPVTANGTTLTKAARTVTWTADKGAAIGPGQYQEFAISVGPLPAPGTLVLPVAQTYSDGTVVGWDEPSQPGQAEPQHPAPQFDVTPKPDPVSSQTALVDAAPAADVTATGPDPLARGLAAGALLVAHAGVGAQLWLARRRSVA